MSNTFEVDGETYTLLGDDDLTFGEARAIERTSGVKFSDAEERTSIEFIQALVWASMKRKNPTLTFSEVDDIPMSILNSLAESVAADQAAEGEAEDPTAPAADAAADEPTLTRVAL